ncbi:ATPase [Marinospirillum perlucidum]|uniref:ATPase n=1 Tax=Marinospirillum perlucidum TaxID=1982602 RepID=UPI000DF2087A|nr:ATPase [Marinospirillum perlucidum]
MQIKTLADLVDWTRQQHLRLAECLAADADQHTDERAKMLLSYLAGQEKEMEKKVVLAEERSDPKVANTYIFDYVPYDQVRAHPECDGRYLQMDANAISREVFSYHEDIITLYQTLLARADIPEAEELMQLLLEMEDTETRRLVIQTERMDDL